MWLILDPVFCSGLVLVLEFCFVFCLQSSLIAFPPPPLLTRQLFALSFPWNPYIQNMSRWSQSFMVQDCHLLGKKDSEFITRNKSLSKLLLMNGRYAFFHYFSRPHWLNDVQNIKRNQNRCRMDFLRRLFQGRVIRLTTGTVYSDAVVAHLAIKTIIAKCF